MISNVSQFLFLYLPVSIFLSLLSTTTTLLPYLFTTYYYSIEAVERVHNLDIDVQGVQKVKKSLLKAYYIFIPPPSKEALEQCLRGRATKLEDAIQTRLANANKEFEYGQDAENFDCIFVIANLKSCFEGMAHKVKTWFSGNCIRG
jgi:guanylate kinase